MKKLAFIVLLPVLFSGCRIACNAEKVIAARFANAIAVAGNCTNPTAIQVDVLAALDVAKLCAAKEFNDDRCKEFASVKQGPIANVICPLATAALVSVVGTYVPERYGCHITGSPFSAVVLQACLTLPL